MDPADSPKVSPRDDRLIPRGFNNCKLRMASCSGWFLRVKLTSLLQVSQWKKEIQDQSKTLFEGKRGPKPVSEQSDPERLYSEIGKLKMELDWLKKKSGISLP